MDLENIILNGKNSLMGTPIKNKQFINYLTKSINFNYLVKGQDLIFPAPQPVSIEKKDFIKLKQYKYYTSLKFDGVRFLMYFIKDKNDKNQCIIVNRALNFYSISIEAEDTLYNGTILDGEIIYDLDNKRWNFIVHDAIILCGNKINKLKHSMRLSDTKCCIQSFVSYNNTSTLNIIIKEFYPFEEFKDFIENIYNKSDNNDGIIFMPENLPVISGTQYSMLKWKPKNKNTFDFLVKESEIGLQAFVFNNGNLTIFANIYEKTKEGKEFIEKVKQLDNYKNECIVECIFVNNNFSSILVRTDKTYPNSLRTVERTLFNINENIIIQDLIDIK